MKHLHAVSRTPQRAQTEPVNLAAIFDLLANIFFVIGTAVVAKENAEFPTIPPPSTE